MPAVDNFSDALISWQAAKGRHSLPWQINPDPFKVWVSEIMLQQTQVSTVIGYYQKFIKRFSSIKLLAKAEQDEVLSYWSGLGYYARARNLHLCAQILYREKNGCFPKTIQELCELPGIGKSTAGAILSLGHNIRAPILDGNVKRVLARYHALPGSISQTQVIKKLWELSEQYTPQDNFSIYNQAMMDLGAMVCIRRKPKCNECPINEKCEAHRQQLTDYFPVPKTSSVKLHRKIQMLILKKADQDVVLLKKRPPSGLWGGLWTFPECSIAEKLEEWCFNEFESQILNQQPLAVFKHAFTHFDLTIYPVIVTIRPAIGKKIMESNTYIWYKLGDPLPGGLPAPTTKLLQQLINQQMVTSENNQ